MLNPEENEGKLLADYYLTIKAHSLFQNKLESIYILVGDGRNGKSTIIETLEKKAFGSYSYTAENTFMTSHFRQGAPNPTLFECQGRRNLIVSEPSESDEFNKTVKINKEFTKQITGNDSITCRTLHRGNITYKPLFTPFILANKAPDCDLDKAMMKRLKVIPFRNTYTDTPDERLGAKKINYGLKDILSSEEYAREYVLLLLDYFKNNKDESKIKLPWLVIDKTNDYFNSNNLLKQFFDDHIEKEEGASISSTELYSYFKVFCQERGEPAPTHKKFSIDMNTLGYFAKKTKACNVYLNLKYING